MIPQKFNVCSCHLTFCAKCIYRGGVGVEQPMPGQGRPAPKPKEAVGRAHISSNAPTMT
ncbi:hypothetical protein Hanom_Chr05g00408591 [Helianthus anomalus]